MQRYGHNELLEARPPGFFSVLWDQLNSFVVLLLIAASGALPCSGNGSKRWPYCRSSYSTRSWESFRNAAEQALAASEETGGA